MDSKWDAELEGILTDLTERKKRSRERSTRDRMVSELKKMIVCIEQGSHTGHELKVNHQNYYTEFTLRIPGGYNE